MSEQVPAQEQSAPTLTPAESALQASALQDQLATAKMTNAGAEAISSLENQLVALLVPQAKQEPPAVAPKEQQQQEAPAQTVPTEEQSQETTEEAQEPPVTEAPEPSDRIRLGKEYTDSDKALVNAAHMLVKSGKCKDFTEAFARVSGLSLAQPEQVETEPEQVQLPPEIVNLEAEVTGLEAKLDELAAAEGLYTPEIAELSKKLSKANAKLESAKNRFETQSETKAIVDDSNFENDRTAVLRVTAREYPQMTDKNSEQWKLARDLAKAASDPSHADYEKSISLEAPRFFAEKAAKFLQIKPATAPSAPQPQSTPSTTTAKQVAKPGPAQVSKTTAPQPVVTAQDINTAAEKMVADVLAGRGGPPKSTAPPRYILMGR